MTMISNFKTFLPFLTMCEFLNQLPQKGSLYLKKKKKNNKTHNLQDYRLIQRLPISDHAVHGRTSGTCATARHPWEKLPEITESLYSPDTHVLSHTHAGPIAQNQHRVMNEISGGLDLTRIRSISSNA